MVKTVAQLQDIDSSLEFSLPAFTYLPKITVPNTQITNRAQVTNFAADGLPKFGIDRIMVQQLIEVQNERGASGERVWKPVNDIHDQMRFVGNWFSGNDNIGQYVGDQNLTFDYCEITFYGTGLNLLVRPTGTYNYSVDGGSESSAGNPSAFAGVLSGRNYSINHIFPIVSGLSVGIHTVKIRNTSGGSGARIYGFEVLNTSSTIFLPTTTSFRGGSRLYSGSTGTTAYNSGFESGTLGTRGGHVLVYQKENGAIAKAVTPTNTSAAYLASADHTNEEVARVYHWREFGAGRTDDFSSLTPAAASDRAFTLDDGTTTLVGRSVVTATSETCAIAVDSTGFLTFTFVGTGLDMTWVTGATGTNGAANAFEVFVNGTSVGNWDTVATSGVYTKKKIVSGLPYGTHTVKIQRNVASVWSLTIKDFIVYAPKKPTLPSGAVALADYFIMADFAANATASINHIATGVLRKASIRELTFVNGTGGTADWSIAAFAPASYTIGTHTFTDRQNAYFEYTFFGTGFEHRFASGSNRSASIQISLQNLSSGGSLQNLTTANFPSLVSSTYGTGITFTAGTGIYDQNDASSNTGCGLIISGLPLALYKVRFLNNSAGSFVSNDAFDVITPIHAPKLNGPFVVQNTLAIGSCAVGDLRNFGEEQIPSQKVCAQAVGVTSAPTNTSGSDIPLPESSLALKTTGKPVLINFDVLATNNTVGQTTDVSIYVDGVAIPTSRRQAMPATSGYRSVIAISVLVPLAAGYHKIDAYWAVSGGTGTAIGTNRTLIAQEMA